MPTCYLSRSASCFVLNNVIFPGLGTEEAGISDVHIKMLGRCKSSAYQSYIRTPRDQLARLSEQMVTKQT